LLRHKSLHLVLAVVLSSGLVVSSDLSHAQQPAFSGQISYPLVIRDSNTGAAISNAIIRTENVVDTAPKDLQTNGMSRSDGHVELAISPGQYAVEITAPGYKRMRTVITASPGMTLTTHFIMLDPVAPPSELLELNKRVRPGYSIVGGYVLDSKTYHPIAGADIVLERTGFSSKTDAKGFFSLEIPVHPTRLDEDDSNSEQETIRSTSQGYKAYVRHNIDLNDNDRSVIRIELEKGKGQTDQFQALPSAIRGDTGDHQMDVETYNPPARALQDWVDERSTQKEVAGSLSLTTEMGAPIAMAQTSVTASSSVPVPAAINVGSECSKVVGPTGRNSIVCSAVTSYSLETYVADGLSSEWKSVWNPNSLNAGAVAYRTYAVWYHNHPISTNPSIDICDIDACQAFSPDGSTIKTTAAASVTSGIVLSANGINVIKAEYAAETNGLANPKAGCPDGYAGQTLNITTGTPLAARQTWPCMPDAISKGAPALKHEFNHGRGMSQRGSQRWASGIPYGQTAKLTTATPWQCILDHYYNDNGNSTGFESGARVAYIYNSPGDGLLATATSELGISNLDGSNLQLVIPGQISVWSPAQKHLLYLDNNSNWNLLDIGSSATTPFPASNSIPPQMVSWSPVGNTMNDTQGLIAFNNQNDIYTIQANGAGMTNITNNGQNAVDLDPSWSSDGTKIAADEEDFYEANGWPIVIMNADGSGKMSLTQNSLDCFTPNWSPDGKKIVASCAPYPYPESIPYAEQIYSINTDGSGFTPLTSFTQADTWNDYPQFTQDGRQIVFISGIDDGNVYTSTAYRMNSDGTNLQVIAGLPADDEWQAETTRCRRFDVY
jgi:Stage II sporulation protein